MEKTLDLTRSRRTQGNLVSLGMSLPPTLLLVPFSQVGRSVIIPSSLFRIYVQLTSRLGQATWITLVSLPAILVNTIPRAAHPALGIRDLIGVGIWAGGLGLEILADSRMSPSILITFCSPIYWTLLDAELLYAALTLFPADG